MLVIARKVGETLYIGPDIVLTIREVQGKQVRIGIDAPPSVAIARAELLAVERRVKPTEDEAEREGADED